MAVDVSLVEFDAEDRTEILGIMADLRGTDGWLTFDPEFDERFPPPTQSTFGRMVSGRGPVVPRATWVPAQTQRRSPEPMSIGILHATGAGAVVRLTDKEIDVPDRWKVKSDHSKRGLVLWVPIDIADAAVLDWTLAATRALTRIPLTGSWRAAVHRP